MFHFLATIGRQSWAPKVVPLVGVTSAAGYLGFQVFGHNLIRDLLASQSPTGKREEISEKLETLIISAYEDAKDAFNKPFFDRGVIFNKPTGDRDQRTKIKWFASSTLDPITFGMAESESGVVIGVPSHYNFDNPDSLPSSLFQIRKVKLFKFPAQEKEEKKSLEMDADCVDCKPGTLLTINRESEQGKEYIDALLLSEKAKKFSIVKELFIGDTYKPLLLTCVVYGSILFGLALARGSVRVFGYKDAHLSQRIPFYMVSCIGGYGTFKLHKLFIDDVYQQNAKERAISLSEAYREGAEEYYAKLEKRNKILNL